MSVILLDNKIVHYEVLGRGRPVIFLHGWVGSWRYWVPAMQKTSISFRAYALDLWGFGDTSRDPDQYGLHMQVDLLDRFLLKLGMARIALIGHGLGALVSFLFTQRFPHLVDRIMAVDCPLSFQAINGRLMNLSPNELMDWLLDRNALAEPVRVDVPKTDPRAIMQSFQIWNDLDPDGTILEGMNTPCLLVHGQNDPAIKIPREEYIASLPMMVHFISLEQSGHFPMLDEMQKFNNLLTDFLVLESGMSPRELQLKEEWRRRLR